MSTLGSCQQGLEPTISHWVSGNVIGFCLILLFVPETKSLSLEELDQGTVLHYPDIYHIIDLVLRP